MQENDKNKNVNRQNRLRILNKTHETFQIKIVEMRETQIRKNNNLAKVTIRQKIKKLIYIEGKISE